MADDLDEATKEPAEPEKPKWWIGPWAHVIAIPVWAVLYFPFSDRPWEPYTSVAGAYTALVFCIALGNSFNNSDDLCGDSRARGYVLRLVIPHLVMLALVMDGVFEWLHLTSMLPAWMIHEGRRGSIWYWCGVSPLAGGGYWEGFWMSRKIKRHLGTGKEADGS